jgi:hypothetical protein
MEFNYYVELDNKIELSIADNINVDYEKQNITKREKMEFPQVCTIGCRF